ncbi:nuclear transport factor 2 family protein [Kiloniella antarctica]|uniref:Nuclear transport factor 2 family protein n=1 Tax=Kiloniella antarctica TaxID=1550907 RepID=A0ABW5BJY1_9PROT
MSSIYQAVEKVIALYFDGLYHSDVSLLEKVFHPKAHYVCATEDPLMYLTMEEYFPIVARRQSPASRKEKRQDKIVSISFAGTTTAFVTLNCAIGEKFFTDFLSLIFVDGRWQIISKVFHFDIKDPVV